MQDADDSESEDSLFDNEEDESSSSSEDEQQELKGRARWLKKTADIGQVSAKDARKDAKRAAAATAGPRKEKKFVDASLRRQVIMQDKMTEEELDKKVLDLVSSRGRKGTDAKDVLRQLEVLTKAARLHGVKKEVPVLMHLITAMFDNLRGIDDYLDHSQWRLCYRALSRTVQLLESDNGYILVPLESVEAAAGEAGATNGVDKSKHIPAAGSVATFFNRLHEEYIKAVQHINPHTKEYVDRLADEELLVELGDATLAYYQRIADHHSASLIALLIVECMYYKHDSHAVAVYRAHAFTKKWGVHSFLHPACRGKAVAAQSKAMDGSNATSTAARLNTQHVHPASFTGPPTISLPDMDFSKKLEELCCYIFRHGDERSKTRALLCSVFHHALHDRYHTARDLLLISRIAEFIEKTDVRTQILYNRTLVTIGLCAFRLGMFKQAHECFSGICGNRAKEFLAQGSLRSMDRDLEQERLEKRRQMPYHMHVNPDLLECCHFTSAMILELPLLAKAIRDSNAAAAAGLTSTSSSSLSLVGGPVISKQLRRAFEMYTHQAFVGPPETTREHVLAATKAILEGNWKKGYNYLATLDVWNLLPGVGGQNVKALLMTRIQEEAIRCYTLVNAEHYESMSLVHLCEMFGLEAAQVKKVICRMIFNREIHAAWEAGRDILAIYHREASRLQQAAQVMTEKMTQILESHERILDSMADVYGYKDEWTGRGDTRKGNWSQQGGRDGAGGDRRDRDGDRGGDHRGDRRGRGQGFKSSGASHRPAMGGGGGRGYGGRGSHRGGQGRGGGGSGGGQRAWNTNYQGSGEGGRGGGGAHGAGSSGYGGGRKQGGANA